MKHRILFMLPIMLLVVCCFGCGKNTPDGSNTPNSSASVSGSSTDKSKEKNDNLENNNEDKDELAVNNPETFEELSGRCKLNGAVIEFSDSGCTISPTVHEDDVAYEAAPGSEDLMGQVTVSYDENCIFQIVEVSLSSGAMTYGDAAVGDVKKQTGLFAAGEYDSEGILHAEEVYLYRMVD